MNPIKANLKIKHDHWYVMNWMENKNDKTIKYKRWVLKVIPIYARTANFTSMSKLQRRSKLIDRVYTQSLRSRNRKNPHIKVITNEKRHSIEWKRCKNHDDVWSVIGTSQSSGDRLFFPLSMGATGELCLRALASDSTGPLPTRVPQRPTVFYEVKRDPPQKTRSAINYALTHSDSPTIYTIASYILFYGFFPMWSECITRYPLTCRV